MTHVVEGGDRGHPFQGLERQHRAILVIDVVESVRLLLAHEDDVIDRWRRFVAEVQDSILPARDGRLVKSLGDGLLMEFRTVMSAIDAAMEMHRRARAYNQQRPADAELHLRAGVHDADVVFDDLDIYGAGVNLAQRLASLAGPGETIISPEARDAVVQGLDIDCEDLGECYLKHFTQSQRAYRVGPVGDHSVMWSGKTAGGRHAVNIAVIPFGSSDPAFLERAFVGDILADDLIARLSRNRELRVLSRLSTAAFRNRLADPAVIYRALNCQYALYGTCAFVGERVRVRASLSDCISGQALWSDAIDVRVDDILGGDSSVVDRLGREVGQALVQAEVSRAETSPLPTLQSYTILLGAVALMHRLSLRDFQRAHDMLSYLCERHPRATTPRAWLGKWHVMRVAQGWSPDRKSDAAQARAVVRQALDREAGHSLALAIDGLVCAYINKDLQTASERYEAALRANPSEGLAWLFQSALHSYDGRGALAVDCAQRAQALSPLDPLRYYYDNFTSTAMLSAEDYEGAIRYGIASLRANATHAPTLRILAIAQVLAGRVEEGRATVSRMRKLEPDFNIARFLERYPGVAGPNTVRYADALRTAGLPD